MSEEEIVEKIKTYLDIEKDGFSGHLESETVQGLLDLYNKQKKEIQLEEKEKRIENALLYLKTMEETEDTYELEKILKGE